MNETLEKILALPDDEIIYRCPQYARLEIAATRVCDIEDLKALAADYTDLKGRVAEYEAMEAELVRVIIGVKGTPDSFRCEILKGNDQKWGLGSCEDDVPWVFKRFDSPLAAYASIAGKNKEG